MSHETPTVTPIYTAEDLYGLLSRQESVNLERLAATLAHSLQTSALVVDWVNKQILKERAEQQAQAQAAKDQVEAPAPETASDPASETSEPETTSRKRK